MKINEKLVLKNFDQYIKLVANAYSKLPNYDESAVKHWQILNESNKKWFKVLSKEVNIQFVDGQPYETQQQMKEDFIKNKRVFISKDYASHPYFTDEENLIFRAVHDYIIHIKNNTPFGGKGEIRAYNYHARIAPLDALPALFTEVVGQVSSFVVNGEFPVQKIAVMKGFDYRNVGQVDDYQIKNKELVKESGFSSVMKTIKGKNENINTFAIMTGFNPFTTQYSIEKNNVFNKILEKRIRKLGLGFVKIEGYFEGLKEKSFFIPNITLEDATVLAKDANQSSFIFGERKDTHLEFYLIDSNTGEILDKKKNVITDINLINSINGFSSVSGRKFLIPFFNSLFSERHKYDPTEGQLTTALILKKVMGIDIMNMSDDEFDSIKDKFQAAEKKLSDNNLLKRIINGEEKEMIKNILSPIFN